MYPSCSGPSPHTPPFKILSEGAGRGRPHDSLELLLLPAASPASQSGLLFSMSSWTFSGDPALLLPVQPHLQGPTTPLVIREGQTGQTALRPGSCVNRAGEMWMGLSFVFLRDWSAPRGHCDPVPHAATPHQRRHKVSLRRQAPGSRARRHSRGCLVQWASCLLHIRITKAA